MQAARERVERQSFRRRRNEREAAGEAFVAADAVGRNLPHPGAEHDARAERELKPLVRFTVGALGGVAALFRQDLPVVSNTMEMTPAGRPSSSTGL